MKKNDKAVMLIVIRFYDKFHTLLPDTSSLHR